MRIWLLFAFLFFSSFRIPDLIEQPPHSPFTERAPPVDRKEAIEKLLSLAPLTAREHYELALNYILSGDLEKARKELYVALELEPDFLQAHVQLGFVLLWEGELVEARVEFEKVLSEAPCEKSALYGMQKIGEQIGQESGREWEAIAIYREILKCEKENTDVAFQMGRLLRRVGDLEEAQKILEDLHLRDPKNPDVAIELGSLYNQTKNWAALEKLQQSHPDLYDLQLLYARSLGAQQKYRKAQGIYARIPGEDFLWRERFYTKSRTNPSLLAEAFYVGSKEDDPTLNVPVVKDYYFYSAFHVIVPVLDSLRFDFQSIYYHQRENDIYPPVGVNYTAYLSGAQITGRYDFLPDWTCNFYGRAFQAWGSKRTLYPFIPTARFEPGLSVVHSGEQSGFLDAHIESFITKDFNKMRSEVLRTDYLNGGYGYHPDLFLQPKVDAWAGWIFYHDSIHNVKNVQYGRAQIDLYFSWLSCYYLFQHAHYNHLTTTYFSYKEQLLHILGVWLHPELYSGLFLDAVWEHGWQTSYRLIQPIGNFLFIAPRQYLLSNLVSASLRYQYTDTFQVEFGGHFFYNTLPYRDGNIRGSFTWQF